MKQLGVKITSLLRARWFYYAILGFFVFEALWFVFTAAYPMAFDEEFHLGIIKIYAQQWPWYIPAQPEGADAFGAVARDPSFFFHYIMSFPLRFVQLFTDSQAAQVIFLRLINVGLFAASLVLFSRVLRRAGTSRALTNTALAVFVLIPIVPQLAAHINYDNLLMLLLAWAILAVFNIYESFRGGAVDVRSLALFAVLCVFMAITKYAALPLVAVLVLFVLAAAWRSWRGKKLLAALAQGLRRTSRVSLIMLAGALLAGTVMFAERYGGNMAAYQHPLPDCGKVLSVEQCQSYGPWARNYQLQQDKDPAFSPNPLDFTGTWLGGLHHRLYFAVNGVHDDYTNYRQLPFPAKTAAAIAILGGLAVAVWWRRVFARRPFLVLFLLLIVVYTGILWVQLYTGYARNGAATAINGRYLLPLLLPMAAIMGRAFSVGLQRLKKPNTKPYLAAGAIILLLYGGGVFTFILRSDEAWYWPNAAAREVNEAAQAVLKPIIIEGQK